MSNNEVFQCAEWATLCSDGRLKAYDGMFPIQMVMSDATGMPLLKKGAFGADLIRFGPGEGVGQHTHEGDHILFVIKGSGWVEFDHQRHPLRGGLCYLVPGAVEHAISAETELVMIAVGNMHEELASTARLRATSHPD